VTQARTSNVIPFPGPDERVRRRFERIRLHIEALDQELLTLTQSNSWSSGEWARHTATPIVRTECIKSYLTAANTVLPAAMASQHRRRPVGDQDLADPDGGARPWGSKAARGTAGTARTPQAAAAHSQEAGQLLAGLKQKGQPTNGRLPDAVRPRFLGPTHRGEVIRHRPAPPH
jgi:hypothetical protein